MPGPLAAKVRAKYPGAYDDMDDAALEKSILAKYPEYADLAEPQRGYADTALDVVKGFGKGAVNTITAGTALAPLLNKMAVKTFGRGAQVDTAGADDFLKQFEATNTPQMVGKGLEFAGEIAGPASFSRIAKFAAARKTTAQVAKVIPADAPRLVKKAAPTSLKDVLAGALDDARKPELPGSAGLPTTGDMTIAGKPAVSAGRHAEIARVGASSQAPKTGTIVPTKGFQPRALSTGEEAGIKSLDELSDAISGGLDVPSKGNGLFGKAEPPSGLRGKPLPAPIKQTVTEVLKQSDEIANTAGVDKAAQSIEQHVKLTVNELARKLRDEYGSQRAGKMLQPNQPARVGGEAIKRLAPGPSKEPKIVQGARDAARTRDLATSAEPNDLAAQLREIINSRKGESGAINPKVAATIAAGGAGAAIGGTQGDTTEEHLQNAAIGGTIGAVAVPLVAHALAIGAPAALQNYMYTSLLSSPTSVAKAYLGGVGGAAAAAAEKIAAGDVAAGGRILQRLFSPQHISDMVKGFRNPGALKSGGKAAQQGLHATGGGTETFVGRVFDAANAPAVQAMRAGGVSADDAWRYTLSGPPTTPFGKDIINLWNKYFAMKLGTSLFPRVGIQILERGLERSPLGLAGKSGLNEGVPLAGRVARAAGGSGAALAAYEGSEQVPDWAKPYLIALSSVYALPVAMGLGAGKAADQGKDAGGQVTAALDQFSQNAPFPRYGTTEAIKQVATGASLVPNIVRDVAIARDPHERKTDSKSAGFFGRTKAKIPGLRETLPIKGKNVNISGAPTDDRSTPLKRVLSPASKRTEPLKGVPEKVASEIKRLDIDINPPTLNAYKSDRVLSKVTIPPELLEKSRAERRQFLIPQLEKVIGSPAYASADDVRKKRMLTVIKERAETAGNQRARANVLRIMREQGAFKK